MSSLSVRLAAFASVAVAEQAGFLAASSNTTTANQSATLENTVNMTQFDRLAANEEAYASCSDTPNWNNGWYDCWKETSDQDCAMEAGRARRTLKKAGAV